MYLTPGHRSTVMETESDVMEATPSISHMSDESGCVQTTTSQENIIETAPTLATRTDSEAIPDSTSQSMDTQEVKTVAESGGTAPVVIQENTKGQGVKTIPESGDTTPAMIQEGQAKIMFPSLNEVFYNPVQQFNRDLT